MNLQRVVPDPQKWVRFYKSTLNNKRSGRIQRGNGGTLGPRTMGRGGYMLVKDVVTEPVVTPTEQVVQQAKSEVNRRRQRRDKRKSSVPATRRRAPTTKGNGSTKPKTKKSGKKHNDRFT